MDLDDDGAGDQDDLELRLASSEVVYSVQRMADVLRTGSDAERTFILEEIQQLLGHCMSDILAILLPVICERLYSWPVEVQLTAAASLALLVMFPIPVASSRLIAKGVRVVIRTSGRNLDSDERAFFYQAWASILVEVIPKLVDNEVDFETFVREVDMHITSPVVESRKLAARVLGALGENSREELAESKLLQRVMQLSRDQDVAVRGTTAESMSSIGGRLKENRLLETIFPALVQFLGEDDVRIRATALRAIAQIVSSQRVREGGSRRLFREALPPILMRQIKFANEASEKDQRLVNDEDYTLLDVCSDVFGELLYSVSLFYQRGFRKEALKAFLGMATCNGPIIRRNTAYNMPGVSMALGDRFGSDLSLVAEHLAKDKDAEVRWILASGIHETVRVLAVTGRIEKLTRAVCLLMVDKNAAVCMKALENYGEVVLCFLRHSHLESIRQLGELLKDLRVQVEGNWRMQELLANQIAKCVQAFKPDQLLQLVQPALLHVLENGMPIVQDAAMNAIILSMQYFDDKAVRDEAVGRFWASCNKAGLSYKMRITMIHGASIALTVFSSDTFCSVFAKPLLLLKNDTVSNVRLKLARLLSEAHLACGDLPEFQEAIETLVTDSDPDIKATVIALRNTARARTEEWIASDTKKRQAEEDIFANRKKLPCFGEVGNAGAAGAAATAAVGPSRSPPAYSSEGRNS